MAVERVNKYAKIESEHRTDSVIGVSPHWPVEGTIQLINYSARYRSDFDNVLKNITLEIKHGERIGIVGRTSAGKSSLAMALFRVIEACDGSIVIDGVEISKIPLHVLRSRMTIIPQEVSYFLI